MRGWGLSAKPAQHPAGPQRPFEEEGWGEGGEMGRGGGGGEGHSRKLGGQGAAWHLEEGAGPRRHSEH